MRSTVQIRPGVPFTKSANPATPIIEALWGFLLSDSKGEDFCLRKHFRFFSERLVAYDRRMDNLMKPPLP